MKKKLLLIFAVIMIPISVYGFGLLSSGGAGSGGGGVSCSGTPYKTGSSDGQTSLGTYYYLGAFYTPGTERSPCQVRLQMYDTTGDISGKTYTVRVWSTSGTSLDTELATSTGVTGNNSWSSSDVDFTIASPATLTASTTYAITVDQGGTDGSNYARVTYLSSDSDAEQSLASWGADKVLIDNFEDGSDLDMDLYDVE